MEENEGSFMQIAHSREESCSNSLTEILAQNDIL
jgi:hypothetical protein